LEVGGGPRGKADGLFFQNVLDAIEQGLSDAVLPLPMGLPITERDKRLRKVVKARFDLDDIQHLIS